MLKDHKNNYDKEFDINSNSSNKINYDEKYILRRLLEGKTRNEIALELTHKNYRTLDMYMRRRGFIWDTSKQIYILKPTHQNTSEAHHSTNKIHKIIALFNSDNDPREVAKKLGFKDHRAMAEYMKNKGYFWSSERQNYILKKGPQVIENSDADESSNLNNNLTFEENISKEDSQNENNPLNTLDRLENLLPMLEMIERNKNKLADLLLVNNSNTIPRYVIGGITITKSLSMSHSLDELIKEFSKEKNISQKEIFEVAIIEFLKKYGYENEINSLFST